MSKIIDVSKHQGTMDFNKARTAGVEGVMLRCAYSGSKDIKFDEFATAAQSANMPIGVYAFATWHYYSKAKTIDSARAVANEQASKVIEFLQGKNITGFVALDLELESGQTTSLSKADMTTIANEYMDRLKREGYKPCLYASVSWIFDRMNVNDIKYPIWAAYYNDVGFNSTDFPAGKYGDLMRQIKDKVIMWQYSSKGDAKLFGAGSTYIDLNHIYTEFAPTVAVEPAPPVQTPVAPPQPNAYIVKSGDSLTAIARVHGVSLQSLISANPQITNPNLIRVGQAIIIPISNATPEPQPPVTPTYTIGVGSIVKLKQGAKTYDGKSLASFVYTRNHVVKQISGDRVVITYSGTVVAAVRMNDLILQ